MFERLAGEPFEAAEEPQVQKPAPGGRAER
jgi:hypothetical protein